jgi:hypothetical protein
VITLYHRYFHATLAQTSRTITQPMIALQTVLIQQLIPPTQTIQIAPIPPIPPIPPINRMDIMQVLV